MTSQGGQGWEAVTYAIIQFFILPLPPSLSPSFSFGSAGVTSTHTGAMPGKHERITHAVWANQDLLRRKQY